MLILSRNVGQSITLWVDGKLIAEIIVDTVRGDSVRLAFKAEPTVQILRSELGDPDGRDYA